MDYDKFEWLVNNSRLFMPNAENLGDPFEGTTPAGELEWWKHLAENAESIEQKRIFEHNRTLLSDTSKQLHGFWYVSCWHMNQNENHAMWECYTKSNNSVAIQTTYSTLRECLPSFVYLGMIRYIDYVSERLPERMNCFDNIMHKDIHYLFEQEVRAVVNPVFLGTNAAPFEESLGTPESNPDLIGYAPPINLTRLIQNVVLHPKSTAEVETVVVDLCKKNGLPPPQQSRTKRKITF